MQDEGVSQDSWKALEDDVELARSRPRISYLTASFLCTPSETRRKKSETRRIRGNLGGNGRVRSISSRAANLLEMLEELVLMLTSSKAGINCLMGEGAGDNSSAHAIDDHLHAFFQQIDGASP